MRTTPPPQKIVGHKLVAIAMNRATKSAIYCRIFQ